MNCDYGYRSGMGRKDTGTGRVRVGKIRVRVGYGYANIRVKYGFEHSRRVETQKSYLTFQFMLKLKMYLNVTV